MKGDSVFNDRQQNEIRQLIQEEIAKSSEEGSEDEDEWIEERPCYTVADRYGHSVEIGVEESQVHVGAKAAFQDVHFGPHLDQDGLFELIDSLIDAGEHLGWHWSTDGS